MNFIDTLIVVHKYNHFQNPLRNAIQTQKTFALCRDDIRRISLRPKLILNRVFNVFFLFELLDFLSKSSYIGPNTLQGFLNFLPIKFGGSVRLLRPEWEKLNINQVVGSK